METFFTNRHGGSSHGDFSTWNLALHVGDVQDRVYENRKKLVDQVGQVAYMSQVHGNSIRFVTGSETEAPIADALITDNPDLALAVMVADCIPLLLRSSKIVAAVHVGRAGLKNSVALKTVAAMRSLGADSISGIIGPAICGDCYEVPIELHDEIVKEHPTASAVTKHGTTALNLPLALVEALKSVEVMVESSGICTYEDDNYFSYRRNKITGRQVGVIKL